LKILAIETSCDDTAAAVVENGRRVLSSTVNSQTKIHLPYSGVVPELASRAHVTMVNHVVNEALAKAGLKGPGKIDAIAVTVGPGLVGSLLVGRMTAETLGWAWNKRVIGVNHLEGHLLSPLIDHPRLAPPFLALVVSGGHTELIICPAWGRYRLIGKTRDDAAGEAFDKVARIMGLGYPGGPLVDRMAKRGYAEKCPFPKPWLAGSWDFSFSGIKTAVLYKFRSKKKWTLQQKRDMCAGFQQAVVEVLVVKTIAAANALKVKTVVVGGGVVANSLLRSRFLQRAKQKGLHVYLASPEFCSDNAAMIGAAAYVKGLAGEKHSSYGLSVRSQLPLPVFTSSLPPFSPNLSHP